MINLERSHDRNYPVGAQSTTDEEACQVFVRAGADAENSNVFEGEAFFEV